MVGDAQSTYDAMNGWMGREGHAACHEAGDEPLLPLHYSVIPRHHNLHQACEYCMSFLGS